MQNKTLYKIKNLAEKKYKKLGIVSDKKKIFPKKILRDFDKNDLIKILGYHFNNKNTFNYNEEFNFYYYATKYCANIRNYFLVSLGMVGSTILKYGTIKQKKLILSHLEKKKFISSLLITEPTAGSNINEIKTNYIKKNGYYILNGKKTWITLGGISNIYLILANGKEGLILFLTESKSKKLKKKILKNIISNRGSHIATIDIKNLKLTKKNILGENSRNSSKALGYALMHGRAIAALSAFSMCSAALDEVIEYSKKREQFGKKIWNFQQIQKIISDTRVFIEAGLSMSNKSFKLKRNYNSDSENFCSMTKLFAASHLTKTISNLMDIYGAYSTSGENNIERYLRESKGFSYIEGTSQILNQLIALNSILGIRK